MQIIHVFQRIERTLRMRPDAQRWRVSLRADVVEVFRRPVLTSDITLGALGLTDAPMPVPVCVVTVTLDGNGMAVVNAHPFLTPTSVPVHMALAQTVTFVNAWVDPG